MIVVWISIHSAESVPMPFGPDHAVEAANLKHRISPLTVEQLTAGIKITGLLLYADAAWLQTSQMDFTVRTPIITYMGRWLLCYPLLSLLLHAAVVVAIARGHGRVDHQVSTNYPSTCTCMQWILVVKIKDNLKRYRYK